MAINEFGLGEDELDPNLGEFSLDPEKQSAPEPSGLAEDGELNIEEHRAVTQADVIDAHHVFERDDVPEEAKANFLSSSDIMNTEGFTDLTLEKRLEAIQKVSEHNLKLLPEQQRDKQQDKDLLSRFGYASDRQRVEAQVKRNTAYDSDFYKAAYLAKNGHVSNKPINDARAAAYTDWHNSEQTEQDRTKLHAALEVNTEQGFAQFERLAPAMEGITTAVQASLAYTPPSDESFIARLVPGIFTTFGRIGESIFDDITGNEDTFIARRTEQFAKREETREKALEGYIAARPDVDEDVAEKEFDDLYTDQEMHGGLYEGTSAVTPLGKFVAKSVYYMRPLDDVKAEINSSGLDDDNRIQALDGAEVLRDQAYASLSGMVKENDESKWDDIIEAGDGDFGDGFEAIYGDEGWKSAAWYKFLGTSSGMLGGFISLAGAATVAPIMGGLKMALGETDTDIQDFNPLQMLGQSLDRYGKAHTAIGGALQMGTAGQYASDIAGIAPDLLLTIGTGGVAGAATKARLIAKGIKVGSEAGSKAMIRGRMMGAAGGSGVSVAGRTYNDFRAAGRSVGESFLASIASGALTAGITYAMGPTGVEALFKGKAAGAEALRINLKKSGWFREMAALRFAQVKAAGGPINQGFREWMEEFADEVSQSVLISTQLHPNLTLEDHMKIGVHAGNLGFGAGAISNVGSIVSRTKNANKAFNQKRESIRRKEAVEQAGISNELENNIEALENAFSPLTAEALEGATDDHIETFERTLRDKGAKNKVKIQEESAKERVAFEQEAADDAVLTPEQKKEIAAIEAQGDTVNVAGPTETKIVPTKDFVRQKKRQFATEAKSAKVEAVTSKIKAQQNPALVNTTTNGPVTPAQAKASGKVSATLRGVKSSVKAGGKGFSSVAKVAADLLAGRKSGTFETDPQILLQGGRTDSARNHLAKTQRVFDKDPSAKNRVKLQAAQTNFKTEAGAFAQLLTTKAKTSTEGPEVVPSRRKAKGKRTKADPEKAVDEFNKRGNKKTKPPKGGKKKATTRTTTKPGSKTTTKKTAKKATKKVKIGKKPKSAEQQAAEDNAADEQAPKTETPTAPVTPFEKAEAAVKEARDAETAHRLAMGSGKVSAADLSKATALQVKTSAAIDKLKATPSTDSKPSTEASQTSPETSQDGVAAPVAEAAPPVKGDVVEVFSPDGTAIKATVTVVSKKSGVFRADLPDGTNILVDEMFYRTSDPKSSDHKLLSTGLPSNLKVQGKSVEILSDSDLGALIEGLQDRVDALPKLKNGKPDTSEGAHADWVADLTAARAELSRRSPASPVEQPAPTQDTTEAPKVGQKGPNGGVFVKRTSLRTGDTVFDASSVGSVSHKSKFVRSEPLSSGSALMVVESDTGFMSTFTLPEGSLVERIPRVVKPPKQTPNVPKKKAKKSTKPASRNKQAAKIVDQYAKDGDLKALTEGLLSLIVTDTSVFQDVRYGDFEFLQVGMNPIVDGFFTPDLQVPQHWADNNMAVFGVGDFDTLHADPSEAAALLMMKQLEEEVNHAAAMRVLSIIEINEVGATVRGNPLLAKQIEDVYPGALSRGDASVGLEFLNILGQRISSGASASDLVAAISSVNADPSFFQKIFNYLSELVNAFSSTKVTITDALSLERAENVLQFMKDNLGHHVVSIEGANPTTLIHEIVSPTTDTSGKVYDPPHKSLAVNRLKAERHNLMLIDKAAVAADWDSNFAHMRGETRDADGEVLQSSLQKAKVFEDIDLDKFRKVLGSAENYERFVEAHELGHTRNQDHVRMHEAGDNFASSGLPIQIEKEANLFAFEYMGIPVDSILKETATPARAFTPAVRKRVEDRRKLWEEEYGETPVGVLTRANDHLRVQAGADDANIDGLFSIDPDTKRLTSRITKATYPSDELVAAKRTRGQELMPTFSEVNRALAAVNKKGEAATAIDALDKAASAVTSSFDSLFKALPLSNQRALADIIRGIHLGDTRRGSLDTREVGPSLARALGYLDLDSEVSPAFADVARAISNFPDVDFDRLLFPVDVQLSSTRSRQSVEARRAALEIVNSLPSSNVEAARILSDNFSQGGVNRNAVTSLVEVLGLPSFNPTRSPLAPVEPLSDMKIDTNKDAFRSLLSFLRDNNIPRESSPFSNQIDTYVDNQRSLFSARVDASEIYNLDLSQSTVSWLNDRGVGFPKGLVGDAQRDAQNNKQVAQILPTLRILHGLGLNPKLGNSRRHHPAAFAIMELLGVDVSPNIVSNLQNSDFTDFPVTVKLMADMHALRDVLVEKGNTSIRPVDEEEAKLKLRRVEASTEPLRTHLRLAKANALTGGPQAHVDSAKFWLSRNLKAVSQARHAFTQAQNPDDLAGLSPAEERMLKQVNQAIRLNQSVIESANNKLLLHQEISRIKADNKFGSSAIFFDSSVKATRKVAGVFRYDAPFNETDPVKRKRGADVRYTFGARKAFQARAANTKGMIADDVHERTLLRDAAAHLRQGEPIVYGSIKAHPTLQRMSDAIGTDIMDSFGGSVRAMPIPSVPPEAATSYALINEEYVDAVADFFAQNDAKYQRLLADHPDLSPEVHPAFQFNAQMQARVADVKAKQQKVADLEAQMKNDHTDAPLRAEQAGAQEAAVKAYRALVFDVRSTSDIVHEMSQQGNSARYESFSKLVDESLFDDIRSANQSNNIILHSFRETADFVAQNTPLDDASLTEGLSVQDSVDELGRLHKRVGRTEDTRNKDDAATNDEILEKFRANGFDASVTEEKAKRLRTILMSRIFRLDMTEAKRFAAEQGSTQELDAAILDKLAEGIMLEGMEKPASKRAALRSLLQGDTGFIDPAVSNGDTDYGQLSLAAAKESVADDLTSINDRLKTDKEAQPYQGLSDAQVVNKARQIEFEPDPIALGRELQARALAISSGPFSYERLSPQERKQFTKFFTLAKKAKAHTVELEEQFFNLTEVEQQLNKATAQRLSASGRIRDQVAYDAIVRHIMNLPSNKVGTPLLSEMLGQTDLTFPNGETQPVWHTVSALLSKHYGKVPVIQYDGSTLNRDDVGFDRSGVITDGEGNVSHILYDTSMRNGQGEVDSGYEMAIRDLLKHSLSPKKNAVGQITEDRLPAEFQNMLKDVKNLLDRALDQEVGRDDYLATVIKAVHKNKLYLNGDLAAPQSLLRQEILNNFSGRRKAFSSAARSVLGQAYGDGIAKFSHIPDAEFLTDILFDPRFATAVSLVPIASSFDVPSNLKIGNAEHNAAARLTEAVMSRFAGREGAAIEEYMTLHGANTIVDKDVPLSGPADYLATFTGETGFSSLVTSLYAGVAHTLLTENNATQSTDVSPASRALTKEELRIPHETVPSKGGSLGNVSLLGFFNAGSFGAVKLAKQKAGRDNVYSGDEDYDGEGSMTTAQKFAHISGKTDTPKHGGFIKPELATFNTAFERIFGRRTKDGGFIPGAHDRIAADRAALEASLVETNEKIAETTENLEYVARENVTDVTTARAAAESDLAEMQVAMDALTQEFNTLTDPRNQPQQFLRRQQIVQEGTALQRDMDALAPTLESLQRSGAFDPHVFATEQKLQKDLQLLERQKALAEESLDVPFETRANRATRVAMDAALSAYEDRVYAVKGKSKKLSTEGRPDDYILTTNHLGQNLHAIAEELNNLEISNYVKLRMIDLNAPRFYADSGHPLPPIDAARAPVANPPVPRPTPNPTPTGDAGIALSVPGISDADKADAVKLEMHERAQFYKSNLIYAKLVDAGPSPMLDTMNGWFATLSEAAMDTRLNEDMAKAALSTLSEARKGNLRMFSTRASEIQAELVAPSFTRALIEGVNPHYKKTSNQYLDILAQDHKIMKAFAKNGASRTFALNTFGQMDLGLRGKAGRAKHRTEMILLEEELSALTGKMGVNETSHAYAAAQISTTSPDSDSSEREQIERNIETYENALAINEAGDIDRASVVDELRAQVKPARKAIAEAKKWLAANQGIDNVGSTLDAHMMSTLNETQQAYVDFARKTFEDLRPQLEMIQALREEPLGTIDRYIPIRGYDTLDSSSLTDTNMNIQDLFAFAPIGSEISQRHGQDQTRSIDFNGHRAVTAIADVVLYKTSTFGEYEHFNHMFGRPEHGIKSQLISMGKRDKMLNGVSKEADVEMINNFFRGELDEQLNSDTKTITHNNMVSNAMRHLGRLGARQGLTGLDQPLKQIIPVLFSYMVTHPTRIPAILSRLSKLMASGITEQGKKGFEKVTGQETEGGYARHVDQLILKGSPEIHQRGFDGIEEAKGLFDTMSVKDLDTISRKLLFPARFTLKALDKMGDTLSKLLITLPDAALLHAIYATEYEKVTGKPIDATTADNIDVEAATKARIVAEGFMAQSDSSKKAGILKPSDNAAWDAVRTVTVAWGNHMISLGGKANASLSMVRHGDFDSRVQGLKNLLDFTLQAAVFRAIGMTTLPFILASMLLSKDDDDEDEYLKKHAAKQSEIAKWIEDHSFFRAKKPIDSEKFMFAYWSKFGTEMLGAIIPLAAVPQVNGIINDYVTKYFLNVAGFEDKRDQTEFYQQEFFNFLNRLGPAGVPISTLLKIESLYRTGGYAYEPDRNDFGLMLTPLVGLREVTANMIRDVADRNDSQVFAPKEGEEVNFYKGGLLNFKAFETEPIKRPDNFATTISDKEAAAMLEEWDGVVPKGYRLVTGKLLERVRNDGDSYVIRTGLLEHEVIRLNYVDTFETKQDDGKGFEQSKAQAKRTGMTMDQVKRMGAEGKYYMRDLIAGKKISVLIKTNPDGSDVTLHGGDRKKSIAFVKVGGKNVRQDEMLIAKGYADLHGPRATNLKGRSGAVELQRLQKIYSQAQRAGVGFHSLVGKKKK